MTDTADPSERMFLAALLRAVPDGPRPEAYLMRRAVLARRRGGGNGAALIAAAAELLVEDGLSPPEWRGCLRAALTEAPCLPSDEWFWEEGRSDLMGLHGSAAPEGPVGRSWVAKASLPAVALLTVAALACKI